MISPSYRFMVLKHYGFRCVYCGRGATERVILQVDHAQSRIEGGSDEFGNLVASCEDCNFGKGASSVPVHGLVVPPPTFPPDLDVDSEGYVAWEKATAVWEERQRRLARARGDDSLWPL